MKFYIITEEQLQTLRKKARQWMDDYAAITVLDMLAGLPEHTPVILETDPQPEAPKDWSGHSLYGNCYHCEFHEEYPKQLPCCECSHAGGEVDHWQPRTP